eukprot:2832716-Rhodomonas_salina.1
MMRKKQAREAQQRDTPHAAPQTPSQQPQVATNAALEVVGQSAQDRSAEVSGPRGCEEGATL